MKDRSNARVSAVILAGGSSTRMGEAKQLLRLGDSTVLERTIGNVRDAGIDEIVLVLGSSAEIIRQKVPVSAFSGLTVVVNQNYSQGMASSLREGLSAIDPRTGAALIVLADQPFIRAGTFRLIVDRYRRSRAQIVVPMYKGFRGNPVLLDRSVFPEVMALGGDIGCRAIFGSHHEGIVQVEVEDIAILLDIDNRDDYERLRQFGQTGTEESVFVDAATREAREMPDAQGSSEQPALPRDELIIVGGEAVALALAQLGNQLKWAVTIIDPLLRTAAVPSGARLLHALDFSRLPKAGRRYVVVASRGKFDEDAVEQALHAQSAYIGLVANSRRGREILRNLERKGEPADRLAAVRVPAGLDIGAKAPEEIALSILAEIVSRRAMGYSKSTDTVMW